ncbi:MAG: P-loop domain-containing protein [Candidatus Latescibacterota bacterium]
MQTTVQDAETLRKLLHSLEGRHLGGYNELSGEYDYGDFILAVDYIPEDPARQPARLRVRMSMETARFPKDVFNNRGREIGARDFLARTFVTASSRFMNSAFPHKEVRMYIDRPGPEILETSAVVTGNGEIEIRFAVDLPVRRERIMGESAVEFFLGVLPKVIRGTLLFRNIDGDGLADWIEANEDADAAREMLAGLGLVAFIADGSVLTGAKSRELRLNSLPPVAFRAPEELAVTLDLPNSGKTRGMGIPKGITLFLGAGGQGKSTLLKALELGVYNHIPGDGRELAVTAGDAVGIRAEEGRRIENVDISPFFASSPRVDTLHYSARSASFSFSQAANFMEALEIGASLFLIDEDTSAAELLDRDVRVQMLIPREKETVTTFVDILPDIRDRLEISTVIIADSGDYLDIADTVITMEGFQPLVVTNRAKQIAGECPTGRMARLAVPPVPAQRAPLSHSLEPEKPGPQERIRTAGRAYIQYGGEYIDCSRVTQLVSASQGRSISRGIALVHRFMDSSKSLREAVDQVMGRVKNVGLDTLSGRLMGDLSAFRAYELAAAVNRMKKVKIK